MSDTDEHLAFVMPTRSDGEDDDEPMDFVFDGQVRSQSTPRPAMERKAVADVRHLLHTIESGQAPGAAFHASVAAWQKALIQGRGRCERAGQAQPARAGFFRAMGVAHDLCLDSLDVMVHAVESQDMESAWRGMTGFESAVQDIDALVDEEKESKLSEGSE